MNDITDILALLNTIDEKLLKELDIIGQLIGTLPPEELPGLLPLIEALDNKLMKELELIGELIGLLPTPPLSE